MTRETVIEIGIIVVATEIEIVIVIEIIIGGVAGGVIVGGIAGVGLLVGRVHGIQGVIHVGKLATLLGIAEIIREANMIDMLINMISK